MRGLKTHESDKFKRFWAKIQEQAACEGCVFFGFSGEGRDFETDDMEGEDFSGWLIPVNAADSFERKWLEGDPALFELEIDGGRFTYAIWVEKGCSISIEFKNYP